MARFSRTSRASLPTLVTGLLAALTSVAAAADQGLYTKRATWAETMQAARANCIGASKNAAVEMSVWQATAPMKAKDFAECHVTPQGIDLVAKNSAGQPLWQKHADWTDGQPHDLPSLGGAESTYLFRTITTKQAGSLPVLFSSDDGIEVWLNGQKLLSRGQVTNDVAVELPLQAGENRLLVKIHNDTGGYSYRFLAGTSDSAGLLWKAIKADFPLQSGWFEHHAGGKHLDWFRKLDSVNGEQPLVDRALREAGPAGEMMRGEWELLVKAETPANDPRWLALFERACHVRYRPEALRTVNPAALRLAIEDLVKTQAGRYARGAEFLKQLTDLEKQLTEMETALAGGNAGAAGGARALADRFESLRREALLANPLLDFERLLLVKRKENQLGLPQNWQGNCSLPAHGYDNEIATLSPVRPQGKLSTFFRPVKTEFVGDMELNYDAQRMLFSMPNAKGRWQVFEIPVAEAGRLAAAVNAKGLRQVSSDTPEDVDNYDPCYLPDGRIVFCSTRCFHGVPCVGGGDKVANLCIMDADGQNVRQLCFDQDHNWCPTMLNNGRLLYTRWEYSDSAHYFTRLLFSMNPDGTNQVEYYGSNSLWPNSTFYARPIPNHPTKVVGIISGHHGVTRMGELVLFDPSAGRHEASGAVQRLPGYGRKVQPIIADGLVDGSWPKFLHPYPLSDKHFLVSAKPTPQSNWGIYLIDVFDNMVLLAEQPGYVLFEPLPIRKTTRPPVIPDKIDPTRQDAVVYLADVYQGKGLQDVPRGTVKKLRIYEPHYAYPGMGGHINIGIDGPWDVKRIWGTVPVEADGSASFRVPANTPISVQPLDSEGKALQVMRSWFTAMPGETVSCVGCHESQNSSPAPKSMLALGRRPSEITPWYGPTRGFSFTREVQPVLDKYCTGCHNGQPSSPLDFTLTAKNPFRNFTPSYSNLHTFVRRPGPESDYHLAKPLEWHANTSELVQMLEKGHYNVKLDAESWDRLITWIDLNVPDFGTWHEHRGGHSDQEKRRLAMRTTYANRPEDPEAIPGVDETKPAVKPQPIAFVKPQPLAPRQIQVPTVAGWPFDANEAKRRQTAASLPPELKLKLATDVVLDMVLVPAGTFVLGNAAGGDLDEAPATAVKIAKPFYLSRCEITNAQFALFDPTHDSAYISMSNKDHSHRGHVANSPRQPVIRINWQQSMDFCRWLASTTGRKASLPTEAQWEWAARAGSATPFAFGNLDSDFSKFANLADATLANFAQGDSPKWHPRVDRFNDGAMITTDVGRYQPNAWGLCDMVGNVAEWTRTAYRPYPYDAGDGRDDPGTAGSKVVRGGSWYDRPYRATSSFRQHYPSWQRVYNVGFRVAVEAE